MGSDSSIPTGFWNHHLIDSGCVSSIVIVTDYHYPLTKKLVLKTTSRDANNDESIVIDSTPLFEKSSTL
jgi:hypothetical protein